MNVGQMARNQQMLYRIMNRNADNSYWTQIKSQLSPSAGGISAAGKNDDLSADLLKSMGISGLEGRSYREMAQYRIRFQNASDASGAQQTGAADAAAPAEGFFVREQYTPISDEATEAMQKLALEDARNSITGKSPDSTERANLIREQLKNVDPSKRAAAFNTMNKVWESETDRLAKYIKEKTSDWTYWGDKFDAAILDDYKPGLNLWV